MNYFLSQHYLTFYLQEFFIVYATEYIFNVTELQLIQENDVCKTLCSLSFFFLSEMFVQLD